MIKRLIVALSLSFVFATIANGQTYRERFVKLFEDKDLKGQYSLLQSWEKATPDDPELYVSFFNHYFIKSRQETLSLTSTRPKGEALQLTKEDDKKVVAYLGSNMSFSKADFDQGISYIDKGIAKFPNRLDMRFGKTYALGQIRDYGRFKDEIVIAIDHFGGGKNAWLWRDGKPLDDPKEFMLKALQDYTVQLFDSGDENVPNIKPIAEAVLRFYPDHVESLSNLSIVNMVRRDFDAALFTLRKAESIAPNDHVIIGNIAYCYFNKKDKANAKKYYERLAKMGDEQAKADATSKLAEIQKWP